jgi:hypothetical protein
MDSTFGNLLGTIDVTELKNQGIEFKNIHNVSDSTNRINCKKNHTTKIIRDKKISNYI